MEEGDAAFESFPGESFRFGVGVVDGVGEIWLESQTSKKRWTCEVTGVAAFAPEDVVLPRNTVLHYVAASLKESAATNGPTLVRQDEDKTLQLEILVKLGVTDFAWAPKYIFPMTLVPQGPPPPEVQAEQITQLTAQVQELQQEVQTLKTQMQAVLRAQAAAKPVEAPVPPPSSVTPVPIAAPVPVPSIAAGNREILSTPSRGDQVWGDIIGHPQHKLVQTEEYREVRNPLGQTIRSHRQHTCKVCSVLRGGRRRPSATSYYCPECTERLNGGMVFLCDRSRPHDPVEYRNATCSQIWHMMWNNGENIPQAGTSSIRMRKKLKASLPSENESNSSNESARPSREASRC